MEQMVDWKVGESDTTESLGCFDDFVSYEHEDDFGREWSVFVTIYSLFIRYSIKPNILPVGILPPYLCEGWGVF